MAPRGLGRDLCGPVALCRRWLPGRQWALCGPQTQGHAKRGNAYHRHGVSRASIAIPSIGTGDRRSPERPPRLEPRAGPGRWRSPTEYLPAGRLGRGQADPPASVAHRSAAEKNYPAYARTRCAWANSVNHTRRQSTHGARQNSISALTNASPPPSQTPMPNASSNACVPALPPGRTAHVPRP